jgi:hypothetical protein
MEQDTMATSSKLQIALKNQNFITAFMDKRMHIFKEGKVSYVNLFILEDKVYASSIREEGTKMIAKAIITNIKLFGRAPVKEDKIKITDVLPNSVVGEIVLH